MNKKKKKIGAMTTAGNIYTITVIIIQISTTTTTKTTEQKQNKLPCEIISYATLFLFHGKYHHEMNESATRWVLVYQIICTSF